MMDHMDRLPSPELSPRFDDERPEGEGDVIPRVEAVPDSARKEGYQSAVNNEPMMIKEHNLIFSEVKVQTN
jgi:hypothetical protein